MSPRSRRYVGRFAILVKAESMDLDGTEGKAFFEENEALTRQRGCAVRENRPPPQLWLNMRSEGTVNLASLERALGRIDGRFLNHSDTRHLMPSQERALSQDPVVG